MSGAIVPLPHPRIPEVQAVLSRDPAQHLLVLSVIEEYWPRNGSGPRMQFYALEDQGRIEACVFAGGGSELLIPCLGDPLSTARIGAYLLENQIRPLSIVGERAMVDALARSFGSMPTRVDLQQRLLTVSADDLGPFVAPQLRLAQDSDVAALVGLASEAIKESLNVDPLVEEGDRFRLRIEARVKAGRTWVMTIENRLCFKVDLGPRCRYGAELENIYVAPEMRRKGLATLGLGQVCRQLLSSTPRLTVRFDERMDSLYRLCRKVGFVPVRSQRMMVVR